jgi:hypothetical protein
MVGLIISIAVAIIISILWVRGIDSMKQNASYDLIFSGVCQNCQPYISYFFAEAKKISQKYYDMVICLLMGPKYAVYTF